jgi:hypothetical protein
MKMQLTKSNYLASEQFLQQWQERNYLHDQSIVREISQLGFLTDLQRSHRVADWAYKQAIENEYLVWLGGKDKQIYGVFSHIWSTLMSLFFCSEDYWSRLLYSLDYVSI